MIHTLKVFFKGYFSIIFFSIHKKYFLYIFFYISKWQLTIIKNTKKSFKTKKKKTKDGKTVEKYIKILLRKKNKKRVVRISLKRKN